MVTLAEVLPWLAASMRNLLFDHWCQLRVIASLFCVNSLCHAYCGWHLSVLR